MSFAIGSTIGTLIAALLLFMLATFAAKAITSDAMKRAYVAFGISAVAGGALRALGTGASGGALVAGTLMWCAALVVPCGWYVARAIPEMKQSATLAAILALPATFFFAIVQTQ